MLAGDGLERECRGAHWRVVRNRRCALPKSVMHSPMASPSKLIGLDAVDADLDICWCLVNLIVLLGRRVISRRASLIQCRSCSRRDVEFEQTVVGCQAGTKGEVAAESLTLRSRTLATEQPPGAGRGLRRLDSEPLKRRPTFTGR